MKSIFYKSQFTLNSQITFMLKITFYITAFYLLFLIHSSNSLLSEYIISTGFYNLPAIVK